MIDKTTFNVLILVPLTFFFSSFTPISGTFKIFYCRLWEDNASMIAPFEKEGWVGVGEWGWI